MKSFALESNEGFESGMEDVELTEEEMEGLKEEPREVRSSEGLEKRDGRF